MKTAPKLPALSLDQSRNSATGAAASLFLPLQSKARVLLFSVSLMMLAACSDSPLSPSGRSIDRVAAARVMSSVTDARARIAPGLQNTAIRDRVVHDLGELELSLANGDGTRAEFHVRVLGTVIADYRAQQNWTTDGAEITAISLVLFQVAQAIEYEYQLPEVR